MIEIRNVSLRLDGKSILNNISLTLEQRNTHIDSLFIGNP